MRIAHLIILLCLILGSFGIQPVNALGNPQIVGINPSSPAQVGTCITVRAKVDWDSEFRSMRIRFGNEGWQESSETEFERNFCTNNYSPGWYTIRVEVAGQGDNDWANPRVAETQYELVGQPQPSKGPGISQFNFSPANGAVVGDSVNIHIRVDSSNPGATTLTADCGWLSQNENTSIEFDSMWNTSGCPAQSVKILVCSRAVDDPNWTNATCSSRSYALSTPQVAIPVPTAELWADSTQISYGQCTYLHWRTSNANSVEIDGNAVSNSGDIQVCPTVTKKYSLKATNQSGTAPRNLTINVSNSSQSSQNIASYFQTGEIIQIGYDIFVIINGERRLVPNPETLDALGISRDWINNKSFSDSELKTIPKGQDIPDVNHDPSGFAAFKNQYFSNTNPINPSTEAPPPISTNQPPGQEQESLPSEQWQVGKRVGLCQGAQIRTGSGFDYPVHTIVPENNWRVDIIDGPRNSDGVNWWDVSRANIDGGGSGWVYFEQAGLANCGNVLGDSAEGIPPQNGAPETQPQPESTQPTDDCGWLLPCTQEADENYSENTKIAYPTQINICSPTCKDENWVEFKIPAGHQSKSLKLNTGLWFPLSLLAETSKVFESTSEGNYVVIKMGLSHRIIQTVTFNGKITSIINLLNDSNNWWLTFELVSNNDSKTCDTSDLYWLTPPISCKFIIVDVVSNISISSACIELEGNPFGYYKTHTIYKGWMFTDANNVESYGWFDDKEKNTAVIGPAKITEKASYTECGIPRDP